MPEDVESPPLPALRREPNQRIGDALADVLREHIATMSNGEQMPSVRTLMKRYGVSMLPVTQALKKLENENLIEARKGKGTYVSHLRNEKLIMLHRSLYLSVSESNRENTLRAAVEQVDLWNFVVRYHESRMRERPLLGEEPLASAHIVAHDLCNLRPDLLKELAKQNVPVLCIDHPDSKMESFDSLTIDESQFYSRALQHLHEHGHQHLALLYNEPHYERASEDFNLFRRTLHNMNLPAGTVIDCETQPGQSSREMAYHTMRRYLKERNGPLPFTGLVVNSPNGGIAALRAMHDFGIRVPEDVSICVISGTVLENRLSVPALTEAYRATGIESEFVIRILQGRFAGASPRDHRINVRMDLSQRESTGPAPEKRVVPRELKSSIL